MARMIVQGRRSGRPPTAVTLFANFTGEEIRRNLYVAAVIAAEAAVEDAVLGGLQ